ncbi:TrlF family AAA-like ATPase [Actinomyces sp.]|uniref:TrlF family AAA-like ATPase n=1 Tax=Actinomyces sp. TaxID=29317 RepID=UPI0026DCD0FA|nr:hypothetical protein [Actinomyces sp.]MDO4900260.1 hypothetical protein [Actinomyces sp.]
MAKAGTRGSEWKRWDLHIHVPTTRLNCQYKTPSIEALPELPKIDHGADDTVHNIIKHKPDEARLWWTFCTLIAKSSASVFGLTDYFRITEFHKFNAFWKMYLNTLDDTTEKQQREKVFFPNLELRLDRAVNGKQEPVDYHIIFDNRPEVLDDAKTFLYNLTVKYGTGKTQVTKVANLQDAQCKHAFVTLDDIHDALVEAFPASKYTTCPYLTIVPNNSHGVAPRNPKSRIDHVADDIRSRTDVIFGNHHDYEFYTKTDIPKPVIAGSDAHSFEELQCHCEPSDQHKKLGITWIKSTPTFAGLQQILVEPVTRVKIADTSPLKIRNRHRISKISFPESANKDFPSEILFNPNFNAIIGSRSSGKSTLLKYIAKTSNAKLLDGDELEEPAANQQWPGPSDMPTITWGDGSTELRRLTYIGQGQLAEIGENAKRVADLIEPTLANTQPTVIKNYNDLKKRVDDSAEQIVQLINKYFEDYDLLDELRSKQHTIGDREGLEKERSECLRALGATNEGPAPSSSTKISDRLTCLTLEKERVDRIIEDLGAKITELNGVLESDFDVNIDIQYTPAIEQPDLLRSIDSSPDIQAAINQARNAVRHGLRSSIIEVRMLRDGLSKIFDDANDKCDDIAKELDKLQVNSDTLARLNQVTQDLAKHEEVSRQIEARARLLDEDLKSIDSARREVTLTIENTTEEINRSVREIDGIRFSLEWGIDEERSDVIVERLNRHQSRRLVDELESDFSEVFSFSAADIITRANEAKYKAGSDSRMFARDLLSFQRLPRWAGELEDDRIGGYSPASMTPGKQALFALKLIFGSSSDPWPILIDQPEDDLDSRSIYDTLVPYLREVREERQLLVVSHDANVVVSSDAEEVIVANRHGRDRKNQDDRTFDYLTGALEDSRPRRNSQFTLDTQGIREHACAVLDGGEDAFRKRAHRYSLT